ncbi:MAG: NAD-dependent epimerase [Defluviitaleaceae bacterium]|nr:NAD-dependent epimerase [Defluviitaleaceae bacterium]MCL2274428.1 NAD-dependent epimerase [Defluviitaleaceae bacterium]
MVYLVTGVAGFIGFHVAAQLLEGGARVVGYDNVNDYYSVLLKEARLRELERYEKFTFIRADLADKPALDAVFTEYDPPIVIHLAAQAGVRYSLENPDAYVQSNLVGFTNILECCRHFNVKHLLYASSSSVYGANTKLPFSVEDRVDNPVSLYAATKKANELMAHTYSHLFNLPTTGMRFFTVYGPWGRPDMAPFLFLDAILNDKPIKIFNHGDMQRDFTYIDDVVKSVIALAECSSALRVSEGTPPYKVYNIGNNQPEKLMDFINILEELTGKAAKKELLPMQPGDVYATFADIDELIRDTKIKPETSLRAGLEKFVNWWREKN